MKLRLPHKFQAALMAALASVSFTTLSTGSTAQADVDTYILTFGKDNTIAKPDWADEIVIVNGTGSKTQALGDTGVTLSMTISSGLIWTQNVQTSVGADWNTEAIDAMNRALGENIVNTGLNGLATAASAAGGSKNYYSLGNTSGSDAFKAGDAITIYVGVTGTNGTPSGNYFVEGLESGYSVKYATAGGTGFTNTASWTANTGSLTIVEITGTINNVNSIRFGLEDGTHKVGADFIAFKAVTPIISTFTWAGTQEDNDWSHAVWNDPKVPFEENGDAVFGSTGYEQAAITTAVTAGNVTVGGQDYTFTLSGSGALTAKKLTVESGLSITGSGTATASTLDIAAGKTVSIEDGAKLTVDSRTGSGKISGDGTFQLNQAEKGDVTINADNFTGTFIFNEGNVAQHDTSIIADAGFAGTLEIRGRIRTGSTNFGDAKGIRFVADRSSNSTGVWSNSAATWDKPIEIAKATPEVSGAVVQFELSNTLTLTGALSGNGTLMTTNNSTLNIQGGGNLDTLYAKGGSSNAQVNITGKELTLNHLYAGGSTTNIGTTVNTGQLRLSENGLNGVVVSVNDGGILNITGTNNTVSTSASMLLAHWGQTSTLRLNGGTINAADTEMHLSWTGTGTFAANSGTAYIKGIDGLAQSNGLRGAFSLGAADSGSATVVLGSTGLKNMGGSVSLTLGCGTLGAAADWTLSTNAGTAVNANFIGTVGNGTVIDTSSHTITFSNGTTGAGIMTVTGGGTLILNGGGNRTGATTVKGGATLEVNNAAGLGTGTVTVTDGGTLKLAAQEFGQVSINVDHGAVIAQGKNSGTGIVRGTITIGAGGKFTVNGHHDIFGWGDNATAKIVLQGDGEGEGHMATLQLNQDNNTNSATMKTALEMKGYAAITSKEGTRGFNTYGGSITVTGDHNTIDIVDIRENATIEVTNAGDELTIAKMTKNNEGSKVLTKTGAGTLRFTGSAAANGLNVNAGTVSFANSADIANNLTLGTNAALTTAGTVAVSGTASLAAGSSWTNTGSNATVAGNFTSAGALDNSGTMTFNGGSFTMNEGAGVTNSGTMTFNGDFSMATGSTVTNTGAITFNGAHTLTLAQGGFVNNTGGSVTLNSGTIFNLANLTAENNTYTLFTGDALVDLSGYGFSVANITGFSGEGSATDYGWTFGNNGTITYSTTVVYGWAGTQGEWMAENAWTKNGEQATFVSSPNSDAQFGASSETGFVKSIAVNSAVVAHDMTVGDAYTFTLGNGGSITANSIKLDGEGASLTVNGTGTVTTMGISANGKTVTLDRGILLQGGTADDFNLDGSGTYALGAGTSALGSVTLADSWAGTLKFSNVATYTNINLNDTAFKNTSAAEFDGVTGNWCDGQNEFTRHLVLSGRGLTLSNGYSSANYYFDGGISGAGDMNYTWTASVTQNLHFRKDISGWTGSLNLLNGFTVNANFYGEATDVYAGISRTGGTLNVNVGDGTNAYTATFHNTVGASALTVKAQANATFNEAVTLAGNINLNGSSTATFQKAVSAAALTVGDTKSTGATATFNGALTLSGGFSLNGTEAANATVALNGDTTVNGSFDLSNGQTAHGTVTLASEKTLDLKGSIWMSQNASLILQKDATAKLGTALTVKGLEDGATITRPGSADQYNLNNSSYTLTKVEATVNSDQNDVQLRFADSKFVTSHNVTLKNLQSVFSGMDIQGGTTTVGASDAAGTVQLGAVALSGGGNLTLAAGVTGITSGVTVTGTDAISGGTLKMDENAVITLGDSAALTLSGVTVDLSAKDLQGGDTGYVDTKDVRTKTGNGFAYTDGKVRLVDFTAGGSVTEGGNVQYMHGINSGSLVTTDGDDKGYVIFADTNHAAYFMNVADTTEFLSDIQSKAGLGFSEVNLNAGTLDTTDAEMLYTLHVNSGEGTVYVTGDTASIITLDGSGRLSVGAGTNLNGTYLNIAASDTLTLEGGATITYTNISNQGTLDIGANTTVAVTNTGMGASGTTFTTTGEGVLQTGGFTLSGGTVSLGSDAKLTGNVQLNSGRLDIGGDTDVDGTLLLGTDDGYTSDIHVLENASLTVNSITASWGFHSLTVDGALNVDNELKLSTGSQTYTIEGSGTVNTNKLTLANVGKYVIDGSHGLTLVVGSGGISDGGSNHTLTLANGLTVKASAGWAMGQNAMLNGTVTVDTQGYDVTISSVLSNASGATGNIAKNGAGTLVLSGNNTYSGDTTVNGGTLELSGANTYTGATTVNAGTLKTNHLGTGGTTVNAGTLELTGTITAGGNLTLTDGATLVLAGANMLTMDGGLSLSGNVTFDLNNIIPPSQGDYVLATGSSASIADGAAITVNWDSKPEYFSMGDVHVVDGTKWVITLTSLGQDLIWNGGEGIWSSTEQMWHTDSLQNQVFRTGDSAIFESNVNPAFAMLAEAVEADKVTVQSGATVAIMAGEGEVSLTAAEMEVAGNLSTGANVTATEIVGNGEAATWAIGSGTTVTTGVLEVEDGAALSFSGSGTLTAGTITGDGTIAFGEGFQPDVTAITVAAGKELALSGAVNKTIAMSNLSLEGTLVLQDGYHLTISDQLAPGTAGQALNIRNNAALTVSLSNADNILNMDAASDGDLYLNSGYISYRSELGTQTVHMANGTQLWFGEKPGASADAAVFTNNIVLDGNATVRVYGGTHHTSATVSGDVSGAGYTLTKNDGNQTLTFTGNVTLGGLATDSNAGGTIQFAGGEGSVGSIVTNGPTKIQFSAASDPDAKNEYTFTTFNIAPSNGVRWLVVDQDVKVSGTGNGLGSDNIKATINGGWNLNGGGLDVNGSLVLAGAVSFDGPGATTIKGSGDITATALNISNGTTTTIQGGVTINIVPSDDTSISANHTGIFKRAGADSTLNLADATLTATTKDWEMKGSINTVNLTNASTGTAFNAADGRTITLSKAMGGAGKLVKAGEGTVLLTGNNSYSGGTSINAGKVVTNHTNALGSGNVDIAATAALEMQSDLTIAGVLSGTGSITYNKATDGTLTLSKDKTNQTLGMNISATNTGKLNLALNGNSDYYFSGNVSVNNITQSASVTLFVAGSGSVTTTGTVTTGRLVVGERDTEAATVFTLSGAGAQLGSNHTYDAVVQGYGTFQLIGGATQTLTGENKLTNFHGTFAADGQGSVLTLSTMLASDVTFKATNGGEIVLTQTYTMGDNTAVDGGTVKVSNGLTVNGTVDLSKGTLTQTGGTIAVNEGKSLTLGNASITSAIDNSGAVTFTQDITAIGLAEASEQYSVGADDERSTNGNYFYQGKRTEGTLTVVTGGGTVTPGGIKVTQGGHVYTLKADGTATGVTADEVDYSMFLQSEGGTVLNYSDIYNVAVNTHGAEMLLVTVANQATLNVDQNVAAAMLDSGIVNIEGGVTFNGYIAMIGGDGLDTFGNTVKGQIDTSLVGYAQNVATSAVFTDAPVENGGVRFTSEAGSIFGGVRVDANATTGDDFDEYRIDNTRFAVGATKVEMTGSADATIAHRVVVDKVHNSADTDTGKLTLGKGTNAYFLKEVVATSGNVEFQNMAEANGTPAQGQTSVYLNNLEIGAGRTVSFYEATPTASVEDMVRESAVTVKETLTVGDGGTLNADLVMKSGSVMDVSAAQEHHGLNLGCSLTIEPGAQLSEADMTAIAGLTMDNRWYNIATSVEQLHITGIGDWDATQGQQLTFTDYSQFDLDASRVYKELDSQRYAMVYNWAPAGANVGTYTLAIYLIPEPTTSTLSLLALCALAARRRRK